MENVKIKNLFIAILISYNLLFNNCFYSNFNQISLVKELNNNNIKELENFCLKYNGDIDYFKKIRNIIDNNNNIITEVSIINAIKSKHKDLILYLINKITENPLKIAKHFIGSNLENKNIIIVSLKNNLDENLIIDIFDKLFNLFKEFNKNFNIQKLDTDFNISILNSIENDFNIFIEVAKKGYKKLFDKLLHSNIFNSSVEEIFHNVNYYDYNMLEPIVDQNDLYNKYDKNYYKYIIESSGFIYFKDQLIEKYNQIINERLRNSQNINSYGFINIRDYNNNLSQNIYYLD